MLISDFLSRVPEQQKKHLRWSVERCDFTGWKDDMLVFVEGELPCILDFIKETKAVADRGRTHYSAYCIVQFLRHNALTKTNNPEFKIPNGATPILARIALAAFHELTINGRPIFDLRKSCSRQVDEDDFQQRELEFVASEEDRGEA